MPVILLFIFVAVPIAEIAVFIQAGEKFGLWPTLAMVILTAILGTALLRYQGLQTLHRVQVSLERGEMPVGEVFTGLCLLVAGALLLTPGFLTDAVGFTLFVPGIRSFLAGGILQALSKRGNVWVNGNDPFGAQRNPADDNVIDAEFSEVKEPPASRTKIETDNKPNGKTE